MTDTAGASSKTYRKVVNVISKTIGVNPEHTRSPKRDFQATLAKLRDTIDENTIEVMLEFYEMGLRRGIDDATSAVANGKFYFKGDELRCPKKFTVTESFEFPGSRRRQAYEFTFSPEEIGFE